MPGETADTIVRDFIEKDQGVIVYLSDDFGFTRALRNMVSRLIGLRGEVLMPFTTTEAAMRKCTELKDQDIPCVVFIERMINNRPSTDFIIWLSREFPQAKKIVLTWEAHPGDRGLLLRIGGKPGAGQACIGQQCHRGTGRSHLSAHGVQAADGTV